MQYTDYYATQGLNASAGADEIKRAYRKLARKSHPDVSKEPDAEQRFKEVAEAYEVLRDAEKHAAYDQTGRGFAGGTMPPDWDAGFEFLAIARNAGVRALLVHALHDRAPQFYEHYGFQASPTHPLTLMLRLVQGVGA